MLKGTGLDARRGSQGAYVLGAVGPERSSLLVPTGATSDAVASTPQKAPESAPTIEEIIVTAERRETNLQRTAVSASVFNIDTIKEHNITQLTDLTRTVPGMRYQGQGFIGNADVTIRGVSQTPSGTGGPVAVQYFNDVPMVGPAFAPAYYVPTFDLASLQVLKGPQGTTFGKNTVGGAVLINPTPPSFDPSGYVNASYGRYNYAQLEGAGNIVIKPDVMALRIAFQDTNRDGYVENHPQQVAYPVLNPGAQVIGPAHFNDINTQAVRVSLLLQPTPGLRNTTVFDYLRGREAGNASIGYNADTLSPFLYFPGFSNAAAYALSLGHFANAADVPEARFNRNYYTLTNTTTYDVTPDIQMKNIFGYRKAKYSLLSNIDGLDVSFVEIGSFGEFQLFSDEFQVLGHSFDRKLDWIFGGFWESNSPTEVTGNLNAENQVTNVNYEEDSTHAAYFNLKFHVTPKLSIGGGYRYTWDSQTVCNDTLNLTPAECDEAAAAPLQNPGAQTVTLHASAPAWQAKIEYQATDDIYSYALASYAYRFSGSGSTLVGPNTPCLIGQPVGTYIVGGQTITCNVLADGTFVGTSGTGNTIDFRPFEVLENETMNNYEVGVKADFVTGSWRERLNLTVYHFVYKNLVDSFQLAGVVSCQNPVANSCAGVPATPGATNLSTVAFNGGEVRTTGVEGEFVVKPTDNLTFGFNIAYTDQSGTPARPGQPLVTLAAPRWSYTGNVRYVLPWRPLDGDIAVGGNYFYTGSWETQQTQVAGYDVSDLRIDWTNIAHSRVSAAFWMTNIFNEDYIASPVFLGPSHILPLHTANPGDPRLFAFQLNYKWGG